LRRVAAGEEITIANRGVPVARLVPIAAKPGARKLGTMRGLVVPGDFDARYSAGSKKAGRET
jgi:antitoxin (DNA-binding transcriptional repressor) of toxin-antitoxin stability system